MVGGGKRIVSYGKACVAMVLNGLGFTNRRLYLTPQFFESKPVATLLGAGIEARHLHERNNGRSDIAPPENTGRRDERSQRSSD